MLSTFAWLSIALAFLCAFCIAAHEISHPQPMSIMNLVWPVTALYFGPLALWAYFRIGLANTAPAMRHKQALSPPRNALEHAPTPRQVAIGASHCGAGCMLADMLCEFGIAALGITLAGSVLFAEYAIDFAAAWALGIIFQYFAIKPMRDLSVSQALLAAIKADTLSICAFQVGMYAWMALVYYRLFPGPHLTPFDPRYWLMMQMGMICGFATCYPMNWFLIRRGLKEAM